MMNIQTPSAVQADRRNRAFVFTSLKQTSIVMRLQSCAIFVALMFLLITPIAIACAEPQSDTVGPATAGGDGKAGRVNKPDPCDSDAKLEPPIKVTEVSNLKYENSGELEKRRAGLNDIILVRVENLESLDRLSKCRKKEIGLFFNGRLIRGLQPECTLIFKEPNNTKKQGEETQNAEKSNEQSKNTENSGRCNSPCGHLQYHLRRDAGSVEDRRENSEHWADLLGLSSDLNEWDWVRPIEVSVGLTGESPVPTDVTRTQTDKGPHFKLLRVRPYRFWGWLVGFVVGVGLLIWLARVRELLRDRTPVIWSQERPYSLSAVQSAWWLILILSSFIFIWLVTGQQDFSSTALILLSISLGTALSGAVIDAGKKAANVGDQANLGELNQLLSEKEKLEEEIKGLKKKNKEEEGFAEKKAEYDKKIDEIKQKFPGAIGPAHESFLLDILSDANGISFHRFQMLAWTVVLGVFFITSVLGSLEMPEFSTTLLALMGISAGTFIGFKIPENNNVPTAPEGDKKKSPTPPSPQAKEPAGGPINSSTQSEGK